MTIVGIHQPNYMPWAGYFHKLAKSDVFIFLDDAQFPKNSYVNRVKILKGQDSSWLTVPAKPPLGTRICDVEPSQSDWVPRHLDRLKNEYRRAAHFHGVWDTVENMYRETQGLSLSASNRHLITGIAAQFGIGARYVLASDFPSPQDLKSDDRLIELIRFVGGSAYLSGKGGETYQDPAKFDTAGIELSVTGFRPIPYNNGTDPFVAGLSILDAVFHLGWDGAADYVLSTDAFDRTEP